MAFGPKTPLFSAAYFFVELRTQKFRRGTVGYRAAMLARLAVIKRTALLLIAFACPMVSGLEVGWQGFSCSERRASLLGL